MLKKSVFRKIAVFSVLVIFACIISVWVYKTISQNQAGEDLDAIISSLTFEAENNDVETRELKAFEWRAQDLKPHDAAIYHRNMTKLYILRGDADSAFVSFVAAHIQAEISKSYDVIAWLYADIAQLYIDFYTYDLAKECMETALAYGAEQKMDEFFYEYCYVTYAEVEARTGNVQAAKEYYQESIVHDVEDMPEYQPMNLRRLMISANIAMENGDYIKCGSALNEVGKTISVLDYPPIDVLWASGIYCPYLQMQAKLALEQKDYDLALKYMDDMFAAGTIYGQMGSLMSFLADVISKIKDMNIDEMAPQLRTIAETYTQKLILEYPEAFQDKNMMAGTHIYNSNLATVSAFVQQYNVENFYRLVAECAVAVALVILGLIWMWRESIKKSRLDGLTGAYNRKYFNQVYDDMKKTTLPFGIIMFDIDYFKQINDGFGHEAGDDALRDISKHSIALLDSDSKLFRYGGDEFCIVCRHKPLERMAVLAEEIRAEADSLKWEKHPEMHASLSMGVAHSDSAGRDVMLMVDANLYKSKEDGRNRVSW